MAERPVETREKEGVERLCVRRGDVRKEAEGPARDQGLGEAVALLDELLEDLLSLEREDGEAGKRRRGHDEQQGAPRYLARG